MAKQLPTWIEEKEAAKELGMSPLYFRRLVKKGHLQSKINYVELHRCCTQYNLTDIQQYKLEISTLKQTA